MSVTKGRIERRKEKKGGGLVWLGRTRDPEWGNRGTVHVNGSLDSLTSLTRRTG